jgi:hypothetical protein
MIRREKERTVSYRITEEAWSEIEKRAASSGESPHQWARSVLLEKLSRTDELTPGERLLFHYLIRAQYLVTQGFQLIADHHLTSEEWKKLRANAKHRVSELADAALASYAENEVLRERSGADSSKHPDSRKE